MNWLYLGFFISIGLALFAGSSVRFVVSTPMSSPVPKKQKNYNMFFTVLFFALLIFVVACREGFIDTPDYRFMYKQVGPYIENAFNNTVPRVEKGYLFITALLNKISLDSQLLIAVFGVITIVCFSIVMLRYTENVTFSLILFSCNMWISCMNGIRQMLVASILSLFGAIWISSGKNTKKIILFIILTVLLSTIHTSVLLVLPFYLMAKGKFLNKWVLVGLLLTLLLLIFPPLYNVVFSVLTEGLSYASMMDTEAKMGASRLILAAAPVILILLYHFSNPDAEYDESNAWMMNLMMFGFMFSLLSLRMVYFSRMRMYFNVFSTITLPYTVNKLFNKNDRKIVNVIICVLYIAVYLYQLAVYGDEVTDFRLYFEQANLTY